MIVVTAIGNVGRDPEIRSTQTGTQVANFAIATTERFKDKSGERIEKTTWINCVVWGSLVKVIENYVDKGSKIAVTGKLEKRKWKDRDGNERENVEINVKDLEILEFASKRRSRDRDDDDEEEDRPRKSKPKPKDDLDDDLDDSIPF